jgi:hypothetical protein
LQVAVGVAALLLTTLPEVVAVLVVIGRQVGHRGQIPLRNHNSLFLATPLIQLRLAREVVREQRVRIRHKVAVLFLRLLLQRAAASEAGVLLLLLAVMVVLVAVVGG